VAELEKLMGVVPSIDTVIGQSSSGLWKSYDVMHGMVHVSCPAADAHTQVVLRYLGTLIEFVTHSGSILLLFRKTKSLTPSHDA
jgi:hypothetical protein